MERKLRIRLLSIFTGKLFHNPFISLRNVFVYRHFICLTISLFFLIFAIIISYSINIETNFILYKNYYIPVFFSGGVSAAFQAPKPGSLLIVGATCVAQKTQLTFKPQDNR